MHNLVVDHMRRPRPSSAEGVNAHPRENLVLRPRVRIRPVVHLLVDPRQQRNRAVVQRVRQRLRLRRLLGVVAAPFLLEPVRSREAGRFLLVVGAQGVLQRQDGMLGPSWRIAANHVYVARSAGLGIECSDGAGDVEAPVAALGHILAVPEGEHQLVARLGVLGGCEAAGLD